MFIFVFNPTIHSSISLKVFHYFYLFFFHGKYRLLQKTNQFLGTPEDVREMVFKNLDIAGKKGGLFVAPTHLLEPDVPVENVVAYIKACAEYTSR